MIKPCVSPQVFHGSGRRTRCVLGSEASRTGLVLPRCRRAGSHHNNKNQNKTPLTQITLQNLPDCPRGHPEATPSGGGQLPARPPLRTVLESFPSFRLKPLQPVRQDTGTRRQSNNVGLPWQYAFAAAEPLAGPGATQWPPSLAAVGSKTHQLRIQPSFAFFVSRWFHKFSCQD